MRRFLLSLALLWGLCAPASAVVLSTTVGDANYTILNSDTNIRTTTAFSASRTWTLPAAAATCIGQTCQPAAFALQILDVAGAVTSTNTLVIAPQSGDTINGSSASLTIGFANARIVLVPTTANNWSAYVGPTNGQAFGTTTNDNACTGCVGEFISAEVTSTTTGGVVLANATALGITGITITAGDWDCRARANLNTAATTTVSAFTAWTSSVSAAAYVAGGTDNGAVVSWNTSPAIVQSQGVFAMKLNVPTVRYSVAASTSVFLSVDAGFATAAASGYGFLGCRRVR